MATHADPTKASRPFDKNRNGIVVSEGGCLYTLERLSDAKARAAEIIGEIVGYAMNTDATDFVLPNPERQAQCMHMALNRAGYRCRTRSTLSARMPRGPAWVIRLSATRSDGCLASATKRYINNTKSFIGHTMGAAGALELAGNLPAFKDRVVHPTINLDELDPDCELPGLVKNEPREIEKVDYILNNSFGMLGINSALVLKRFLN